MRFLFLVVIALQLHDNIHVRGSKIISWFTSAEYSDGSSSEKWFNNYERKISETGRVFITMLGYPARCENKGVSHACTLSLACWWVGGSSQAGCGANPWIIACCVKSPLEWEDPPLLDYESNQVVPNKPHIEQRTERLAMLQRRNDDLDDDQCGLSSDRVMTKRIIGGDEARFAQFPWQAHIKISSYQCGGVLVSRRFVATAAHCVVKAKLRDITIYLGELDTQNSGSVLELAPSERHKARQKIIHPEFQFRATQPDRFDIALLELFSDAGQSFYILPICLPDEEIALEGRNAVIAGWGKIKPSVDLSGTNVLRSAVVPILDIEECMSWHKIKEINVELYGDMLCAGHKDGHKDACLGDSGGPLIILEEGRWTLAGIISAGFGCGEPNQPGIYHSVPVSATWIRSVINS